MRLRSRSGTLSQNEEPACFDEERTRKKPSVIPKVNINAIVLPSM